MSAYATDAEAYAAQKIEEWRSANGWSYGELSQRMEAVGCPIERSSLQKIEKGRPRRKITVNEIIAFAAVFGVPLHALIMPESPDLQRLLMQNLDDAKLKFLSISTARDAYQAALQRVVTSCVNQPGGKAREQFLSDMLNEAKDAVDRVEVTILRDILDAIAKERKAVEDGK